jgi:hypothetical protein
MVLESLKGGRYLIIEPIEKLCNPRSVGWRSVLKCYIDEDSGLYVLVYLRRYRPPGPRESPKLRSTFKWPSRCKLESHRFEPRNLLFGCGGGPKTSCGPTRKWVR